MNNQFTTEEVEKALNILNLCYHDGKGTINKKNKITVIVYHLKKKKKCYIST